MALQTVREDMARTTENDKPSRDIVRSEAKRFGERPDGAVKRAEDSANILDRNRDRKRVTLGLIALAVFERDGTLARVRKRTIWTRMAEQVLSDADRLIRGARTGGRTGYGRAALLGVAYGRDFRAAVAMNNRTGLSRVLANLTADRFERLLAQWLVLGDLGAFIGGRIWIPPCHAPSLSASFRFLPISKKPR